MPAIAGAKTAVAQARMAACVRGRYEILVLRDQLKLCGQNLLQHSIVQCANACNASTATIGL